MEADELDYRIGTGSAALRLLVPNALRPFADAGTNSANDSRWFGTGENSDKATGITAQSRPVAKIHLPTGCIPGR
jgi:hypothetical protein